ADSAVQSYWTHIHNNQIHAPPKFKGFNYKPSATSSVTITPLSSNNNKLVYQSLDYICKNKNGYIEDHL
ncbi:10648_t:CDS:2, partial [Funneliformis geosporum]